MSNTRILHYAPPLEFSGGIRTYVLGMAASQTERGVDVVVAAPRIRPGDPAVEMHLAEAVRQIRPDVVHVHGGDVLDADDWPDLPVVSTVHEHRLYCPAGTKWSPTLGACHITPGLLKCTVVMARHGCGSRRPQKVGENFTHYYSLRKQRQSAHQHSISHYVADRVRDSGYRPSGGESVIYAPVARPEAVGSAVGQRPYDLLFAGRLVPSKGAETAIRAAGSSRLRPRLAIAGEGPQLGELKQLAEHVGVSDRVDFLGWRTPEQLAELHSPQTLLLVPSRWPEPAGLVAAEAAARGRACLVSNRGGLPELVPNSDQVVQDSSADGWSVEIDRALGDSRWMDERGRDALQLWSRSFDPDVVVPAFSSVYDSVSV